MTTEFTLDADGRPLHGVLHFPVSEEPRPAIVICHGFKGFMDWGFFPPLAELLTERGFVAARFNYSGAGVAPGDDRVTDLEAFRTNTFSRELDETLLVLDAMGEELGGERVDRRRVGLLGHSRGGGIAVLAAAHPSWRDRLDALVTWSAVPTFDRYDETTIARWRETGTHTVVNSRTGQELPLGLELLDDLLRNRDCLDIESAAGRRGAPWLIVHGRDDETVSFAGAESLAAAAAPPRELHRIDEANHVFGAQHPFAGPTPHLVEAINATQTWFCQHLRQQPEVD